MGFTEKMGPELYEKVQKFCKYAHIENPVNFAEKKQLEKAEKKKQLEKLKWNKNMSVPKLN